MNIDEIRKYVQEDYWERGVTKNISGYEKFFIDWAWNRKLVETIKQVFPLEDKRVLDLGCGWGQVVAAMLVQKYKAFGIDISDYAIAQGHKKYRNLEDHTFQGSCHNLYMFPANFFDLLYSNQAFEHIPQEHCLDMAKECFRVAKKDCVLWCGLVLDINNEYQPQGNNPEDTDKTHINIRPKEWWDNIFLSVGWEENKEFDDAFRKTKVKGFSFFEKYEWHSICYKKTI